MFFTYVHQLCLAQVSSYVVMIKFGNRNNANYKNPLLDVSGNPKGMQYIEIKSGDILFQPTGTTTVTSRKFHPMPWWWKEQTLTMPTTENYCLMFLTPTESIKLIPACSSYLSHSSTWTAEISYSKIQQRSWLMLGKKTPTRNGLVTSIWETSRP